jgi:hypothetical protein
VRLAVDREVVRGTPKNRPAPGAGGQIPKKLAEVVERGDDLVGGIPFPYFERVGVTLAGTGPNAGEFGTQNAVFSGCRRSDGPASHHPIDRPPES